MQARNSLEVGIPPAILNSKTFYRCNYYGVTENSNQSNNGVVALF
jgi:hypothetical protein